MSDVANGSESGGNVLVDGESVAGEDDPRTTRFKSLYAQSESNIAALFGGKDDKRASTQTQQQAAAETTDNADGVDGDVAMADAPPKKKARIMDEDDYDDYDEDDDDAPAVAAIAPPSSSPVKAKPASVTPASSPTANRTPLKSQSSDLRKVPSTQQDPAKSSEEVRKKLEEDKKAAEDAAKRSFHTLFYTLENDRDAMLEQQKLEELDRQVDAEISNNAGPANHANQNAQGEQQGKLSSANLGASSLTLKHLIARIDAKRDEVRASDAELRSLMSEVRKNRSKWANEDRVGQEELYEAAEKVLSELKAMTEHSTAFLTRVNKRDAPDYHHSRWIVTLDVRTIEANQCASRENQSSNSRWTWAA